MPTTKFMIEISHDEKLDKQAINDLKSLAELLFNDAGERLTATDSNGDIHDCSLKSIKLVKEETVNKKLKM